MKFFSLYSAAITLVVVAAQDASMQGMLLLPVFVSSLTDFLLQSLQMT